MYSKFKKNKDKDSSDDSQDEIDTEESFEFEENTRTEQNNTQNQQDKRPYLRVIQSAKEFTGPILPGGHRFDQTLICIKYPGNVVNPEKAVETLGGLTAISTAVDTTNRRLELRFRPEDAYSKPACGDRYSTCGFLLRVRLKKSSVQRANNNDAHNGIMLNMEASKNNEKEKTATENTIPSFDKTKYENLSQVEDYELPKLKVIGRVDTEYKFTNLCDFQYLPITKSLKDPEKDECIYDKIFPVVVPPYRWLNQEVPYFLPPAAFSRMASVQQYIPKTVIDSQPVNVIGKTRKRRAGFSNFVHFCTPNIPSSAPKGIETAMKVKFLQSFHLERIGKLFEERPIWSKNALMCKTNFTSEQLKILLPSVAYYFMTGPWRVMWVKLGYDPRQDSSARKYQTLDYRLKAMHGLGSTVKCKRNYSEYNLPYKSGPVSRPKTMILLAGYSQETQKKKRHLNENVYIYKEGVIPPSRQMFYQYCDILVDEIQEMLRKLPDPLPGAKCDPKLGWLPNGFDVHCREIINRQVRAELRKQMNIPEDHPTTLPRRKIRRGSVSLVNSSKGRKRRKQKVNYQSDSEGSGEGISANLGDKLVIIDENQIPANKSVRKQAGS